MFEKRKLIEYLKERMEMHKKTKPKRWSDQHYFYGCFQECGVILNAIKKGEYK